MTTNDNKSWLETISTGVSHPSDQGRVQEVQRNHGIYRNAALYVQISHNTACGDGSDEKDVDADNEGEDEDISYNLYARKVTALSSYARFGPRGSREGRVAGVRFLLVSDSSAWLRRGGSACSISTSSSPSSTGTVKTAIFKARSSSAVPELQDPDHGSMGSLGSVRSVISVGSSAYSEPETVIFDPLPTTTLSLPADGATAEKDEK